MQGIEPCASRSQSERSTDELHPDTSQFYHLLKLIVGKRPEKFEETLKLVAYKLKGLQYAIRGTTSLVLQNIDMNVDDIDIVGDSTMALVCNELFKEYVISPVIYSESVKYKSYFGKFKINNILVEVYGDWQIKNKNGEWSEIFDARSDQTTNVNGVNMTTIPTEIKMFTLMGRWFALNKIKKQL